MISGAGLHAPIPSIPKDAMMVGGRLFRHDVYPKVVLETSTNTQHRFDVAALLWGIPLVNAAGFVLACRRPGQRNGFWTDPPGMLQ